jgi:hypothetical protein
MPASCSAFDDLTVATGLDARARHATEAADLAAQAAGVAERGRLTKAVATLATLVHSVAVSTAAGSHTAAAATATVVAATNVATTEGHHARLEVLGVAPELLNAAACWLVGAALLLTVLLLLGSDL